jgi:hypothetical protein
MAPTALPDDAYATPAIPPRARTVCYVVGVVAGVTGAGIGLALGSDVIAAVAAAVAAGANALAFGYRPTK